MCGGGLGRKGKYDAHHTYTHLRIKLETRPLPTIIKGNVFNFFLLFLSFTPFVISKTF